MPLWCCLICRFWPLHEGDALCGPGAALPVPPPWLWEELSGMSIRELTSVPLVNLDMSFPKPVETVSHPQEMDSK